MVAVTAGFGVPRATAVLAVLGYRIVNFWLLLIPGTIAYLRLRLRRAANGKQSPRPRSPTRRPRNISLPCTSRLTHPVLCAMA
jgi:hypothetical protein